MNRDTLLNIAANSKQFKNLCFKLCNYRYIADDLFQEFLLYIAEKPEEFLINKYNDIQFISYCTNVIKGLNSHRLNAKKLVNTKNTLHENHNYILVNDFDFIDETEYNYEVDLKIKKVVSKLKNYKHGDCLLLSFEKEAKEIAELKNLTVRQVVYQKHKLKNILKNDTNSINFTQA